MNAVRVIADAPGTPVVLRLAPAAPGRVRRWEDQALCAEVGTDLFFPDDGGSTALPKRICRNCPVRAECLDYALEHGIRHGVWGGLSENERRPAKAGSVMTVPVLVVLAVVASAFTKLNAVILGRPVTVPLLMLVFAVMILALAAVLAAIVRAILRDRPRQRPVYVITSLH